MDKSHNSSIGAYMQVYRNDGKADFAWKSFKTHHPDAPAYMVSDAGDDFSSVADKHNCAYEHSKINVGVRRGGYTTSEMLEWIGRMERGFRHCETEFILYMEDDVWIRGTVQPDQFAALSGLYANEIPAQVITHFKRKYPRGQFNVNKYGACGGTIYNRKIFLSLLDEMRKFVVNDMATAKRRSQSFRRISYFDCTICLMYMCLGVPFSESQNLVQPSRDPQWRSCGKPIVHIGDDNLQRIIMKEAQ
jgi:hypothetical protein